mmetsp:Transcript_14004/g.29290  ORF Transcript_14004/g.29290 Transcript_14004/m.29290 type:complete len:654 (+) Transcript_14004:42-2003(+)
MAPVNGMKHRRLNRLRSTIEPKAVDFNELCSTFDASKAWNDLALKDQAGLLREALSSHNFLIDPNSNYMKYWDLVIATALVFTAIFTPYQVVFFRKPTILSFTVNRLLDAVFLKDMCMQFFLKVRLASSDSLGMVTLRNPHKIRMRYLKGWFLIDFASIFPFDLVIELYNRSQQADGSAMSQRVKIVRLLRLLRLVKLVRILRSSRLILRWQNRFALSFSTQKLMKFTSLLLISSHWMACIWGLVGSTFGKDLCDENGNLIDLVANPLTTEDASWVTNLFGPNGKFSPDDPCNSFCVYMASLHWSVMTITSIGYGDIVPVRFEEYLAGVICMLSGGVLWTYVIGSSCSIISNRHPVEAEFESSTDLVNLMMSEACVPVARQSVYREFLREAKVAASRDMFDTVAHRFSPQLHQELMLHLAKGWIATVYYFKDAPTGLLSEAASSLETKFLSMQEPVHGAEGCLCVVERGTMAHGGLVLVRGQVFGQDFIINPVWRKVNTTVSVTYSLLLLLTRERFDEILVHYPSHRKFIRRYAAKLALSRAVVFCAKEHKKRKAHGKTLADVFDCLDSLLYGREEPAPKATDSQELMSTPIGNAASSSLLAQCTEVDSRLQALQDGMGTVLANMQEKLAEMQQLRQDVKMLVEAATHPVAAI